MKEIKNQTIYQCSYCGKRLLSKNGAKIHENTYCKHMDSPAQKSVIEKQNNCAHKNVETEYTYIPGEAVKEPNCDICLDCGARF